MQTRLTRAEDAELRRLAALAEYGQLGEQAAAVYAELRQRDRRQEVRPPVDLAMLVQPGPRDEGPRARKISLPAR